MNGKECGFCKNSTGKNPTRVTIGKLRCMNTTNMESVIKESSISIRFGDKNRNYKNMILKIPHYFEGEEKEFPEAIPENVLKKYKKLKENGFPVVPTFRYDPENKYFLMTDLTENGKNIIIDKHEPLKNTNINIENIDQIKKEILQTAEKAWNNEIFLSYDAYAVVVNKETRIGKLYILDIGQMSYEIDHRYCLIYDTKDDAIDKAELFLKHSFSKD